MRLYGFFTVIFGVAISGGAFGAESSACIDQVKMDLASASMRTIALYRSVESAPASEVRAGNASRLLPGKRGDQAILLVHGFVASPWEVDSIGQALNDQGFTVLEPLLEGFGAGTQVADDLAKEYGYKLWQDSVSDSYQILSRCYSKITLVGFSLGGTLATDFALKNPLTSVVLLSPYYRMNQAVAEIADQIASRVIPSIGLSELYRLSGNPDLLAPLANPEFYNSDMPLKAVNELMALSHELEVYARQNEIVDHTPLLLVDNEGDQTVDWKFARQFVSAHFDHLERMTYLPQEKVHHQLGVRSANPGLDRLLTRITEFIATHATYATYE